MEPETVRATWPRIPISKSAARSWNKIKVRSRHRWSCRNSWPPCNKRCFSHDRFVIHPTKFEWNVSLIIDIRRSDFWFYGIIKRFIYFIDIIIGTIIFGFYAILIFRFPILIVQYIEKKNTKVISSNYSESCLIKINKIIFSRLPGFTLSRHHAGFAVKRLLRNGLLSATGEVSPLRLNGRRWLTKS